MKEIEAVSEEDLIAGCLKGSETFCRMLFEKYYGRMLNVCKRYSKDIDEAKDMLQEGFIRVFKNLKQYDRQGSFEGWMRKVMVTTSINYFRKFHLNEKIDYVDSDKLKYMESVETSSLYNANGSAGSDAEALLRMIKGLPPVYQLVFNLHAIEGYSHSEIAVTLEITESTSRSNLAKARQKLQQMLQPSSIKI